MSTLTLEIGSLAAGGDGVARHEGLVVFTPRTAPGDRVRAEVTVTGRIGRGALLRVERAGGTRVEARCSHYAPPDRCGGCQWQHVDLAAQREAKRTMVRDAFARIAKRDVPLPPIHGGEGWRYRRSLTLAIRRDAEGAHYAGLRAFDDPEAVFALDDCHITARPVLEAWTEILGAAAFLPDEPRLRGTVRLIEERPHLTLEGGKSWDGIAEFLDATPLLAAVWWQGEGMRRRMVADRRPAGAPGASFAQVNPEVAALVHTELVARVLALEPKRVIDAYSGAGETAAALVAAGVQVVAVEADDEASSYAAARIAAPSRAITARVEDVIDSLLPADVVILNPPRSGVDARVTKVLAGAPASLRAIFYVSCDAATLARDVARLTGWRVHALTCYDMFPQTAHVESLCELRREDA